MSDYPKRRPSSASRRGRSDNRAEPDFTTLPLPEALVPSRGRGREASVPIARSKGVTITPPRAARSTSQRPQARTTRPPRAAGEGARAITADVSVARHQVIILQEELSEALRRIASIQKERADESDRLGDLLSQLNASLGQQRETEAKLARMERLASEAVAATHSTDAAMQAELKRLAAELSQERETTAWLRAAGAQATREVSAFREQTTEAARVRLETTATRTVTVEMPASPLAQLRSGLEQANETIARLEQERDAAEAQTAPRVEALGAELEAVKSELLRLTFERDAARGEATTFAQQRDTAIAQGDARVRAIAGQLEVTSEALKVLARSVAALQLHEQRVAEVQKEAHAARRGIVEQAEAARIALGKVEAAVRPALETAPELPAQRE